MRPVVYDLSCCALAHMTATDDTPFEVLERTVNYMKKQAKKKWHPAGPRGGQRSVFTIVSPGEYILEQNLLKLGFEHIQTLDRRNGYPPGQLKMYMLKF